MILTDEQVSQLLQDWRSEREQRLAAEAELDAIDEALEAVGADDAVSRAQAIRNHSSVLNEWLKEARIERDVAVERAEGHGE